MAPGVRLEHAEALLTVNTKYSGDHMGKVFGILASNYVNNQENLFLEQLPKLDVIGFIDNDYYL